MATATASAKCSIWLHASTASRSTLRKRRVGPGIHRRWWPSRIGSVRCWAGRRGSTTWRPSPGRSWNGNFDYLGNPNCKVLTNCRWQPEKAASGRRDILAVFDLLAAGFHVKHCAAGFGSLRFWSRLPALMALAASLTLAACGGGGGGGGGSHGPPPTSVAVSGRITYDRVPFSATLGSGLDYGHITPTAARGIVVE